jgi:hypothetical protein
MLARRLSETFLPIQMTGEKLTGKRSGKQSESVKAAFVYF